MDWSGYKQNVQEWIAGVEEHRGKEAEKILDYAERIREYGEKNQDQQLLGYSYYYIAETYYMLNDVETFFEYILQALEYLQHSGQWKLAARACNLLGIASNNQGNSPFALDYYLSGISICEKHNLPQVKAIMEYNIGSIFMSYGEYERAIHYIESGWSSFQKQPETSQYHEYRSVVYVSLGLGYLQLHNMEKAGYYLSQIEKECADSLNEVDRLYLLCIKARYYNELQDTQNRDACIAEIEARLNVHVTVLEVFDDLYNYCQMLLNIDKYKELWKVLDTLEDMLKHAKLVHLKQRLLELKIEYYKKIGDSKSFLQATGLYYELSLMKQKEEKIAVGTMLNTRFSLEEIRKKQQQMEAENQKLQHQSETDSLTGIANRMRMNREAEETFVRALSGKNGLAVEILDVDYFKEYNDNYGHQKGDECLIAIAREMQKMTTYGNIFCARYGGDEFVLIYENYAHDEVRRLAGKLRDNIAKLAITHSFSKVASVVTVSQGIFWGIPQEGDEVWSYFRGADEHLYQVKKGGRNGISMNSKETDTESPR